MMIEYENLERANSEFGEDIREAMHRVIGSGWYILGKEVEAFEGAFARYVGSAHCIGVANGLDALTISMRALELPEGAEVIVASNTYIATILAVLHAGLNPVLIEPDLATYNMDPRHIQRAITARTAVICVTHLYGKPCRMDEICTIAKEHGLEVLEDCAQSHGARLGGQMAGTFGRAGCFSFYPTKNLGALGDAGAIITRDADFADRLRYWRNYGSKRKYENEFPGYNSRLDELQAAILSAKLQHLDRITRHKRDLAALYFEHLPGGITLPRRKGDEFDVFHIFPVRHPKRDDLRRWLLDQGIKTEIHYPIPPHRQRALEGVFQGEFPVAEEIHATELSLPISFATTSQEVIAVCNAVRKFPNLAE